PLGSRSPFAETRIARSDDFVVSGVSTRRSLHESRILLFEVPESSLDVVGTFFEGVGVKFATRHRKEVASVYVDGAGEARGGVGDGVHSVVAEQTHVAGPQFLSP